MTNWVTFPLRSGSVQRMIRHSLASYPNEACGLLVRGPEMTHVFACRNDSTEADRFILNANDQLTVHRQFGDRVIGSYHSHPRGAGALSPLDIGFLPRNQVHVVIGLNGGIDLRCWWLSEDETVISVPIEWATP